MIGTMLAGSALAPMIASGAAGAAAAGLGKGALAYIPSKSERQLKKFYKSELEATAEGRGGMSDAQYNRELGRVQSQIQGQKQQQLAQVARGFGSGTSGTSGLANKLRSNIYRSAQQAGVAGQGRLRAADMQMARERRQAALQGLANAANMEYMRRTQAIKAMSDQPLGTAFEAGREKKMELGRLAQGATEKAAIDAAMAASEGYLPGGDI